MMEALYAATPLHKANEAPRIRLLRLSDKDTKPLTGILEVVPLDRAGFYYALSYVWGSLAESPHVISCGTRQNEESADIHITTNCYEALLQIRQLYRGWFPSSTICIWIDAICINQANSDEKDCQVPLMADIYSRADQVLVWLGKGTRESDRAMEWLRLTSLGKLPLLGARWKSFPRNMHPKEVRKLARALPDLLLGELWRQMGWRSSQAYPQDSMGDLYARAWFTRSWTTQELVMASEPWIICGSKTIRWSYFAFAVLDARAMEETNVTSNLDEILNSILFSYSFWLSLARWESFHVAPQREWVGALQHTRTKQALGALLDMLERGGRVTLRALLSIIVIIILYRLLRRVRPLNEPLLIPLLLLVGILILLIPARTDNDLAKSLKADTLKLLHLIRRREASIAKDKVYAIHSIMRRLGAALGPVRSSDPLEETYWTFALDMVRWSNSLDILLEAGQSGLERCPSWVPDWRVRLSHPAPRNQTTMSIDPSNVISEDGRSLRVRARSIGVVTGIISLDPEADTFGPGGRAEPPVCDAATSIFLLGTLIARLTTTQKGLDTENWQDLLMSFNPSNVYTRETLQALTKQLCSIIQASADLRSCTVTADAMRACVRDIELNDTLARYCCRMWHAIEGKRHFLTLDSGDLAVGPIATQAGDSVACIEGVSLPIVLRQVKATRHVTLGSAFVADADRHLKPSFLQQRTTDLILE